MGLTTQQMARLSELLDRSLPLPTEQRRTWLESLSGEDRLLVEGLREILLSDDPESGDFASLHPVTPALERRALEPPEDCDHARLAWSGPWADPGQEIPPPEKPRSRPSLN